jgi:ribose/xylose/arabinose/galactoside ABC-type transport system permease subunit
VIGRARAEDVEEKNTCLGMFRLRAPHLGCASLARDPGARRRHAEAPWLGRRQSGALALHRLPRTSESGLLLFLLLLVAFFSFASPYFHEPRNLSNIIGQISLPLCAAIGLALVIISGEVDVSIGSLQAVVALPLVLVLNATGSFALGAIAALATGAVIGVVNGTLVTRFKVNSLIATLGMFYALRGFVYLVTGKVAVADASDNSLFFAVGNGKLGFLPYSALVVFALLFAFMYIVRNTSYGRRLYAVGGNAEVARSVGISPVRMKFSAFVICSILASVSAILLASRLGSANHLAGLGFEFQVIAAVVLGGVSLSGGVGTLFGVLLGVLILGVIQNGLGMMNVNTQWQDVLRGAIIILAVAVDGVKKRRA